MFVESLNYRPVGALTIFHITIMSRKQEQQRSLKRIGPESTRSKHLDILQNLERIIKSQEKVRSHRKYGSSQKQDQQFKISKMLSGRLKTEQGERVAHLSHRLQQSKNPYYKLSQLRKKKTISNEVPQIKKPNGSNFFKTKFQQFQGALPKKHQRLGGQRKAIFLNETYIGKAPKKPQFNMPTSTRANANSKIRDRSDRSIKRKINIENYTSESLQNLNFNFITQDNQHESTKKKTQKTIEKNKSQRQEFQRQKARAHRPLYDDIDQQEIYDTRQQKEMHSNSRKRIKTQMSHSRQRQTQDLKIQFVCRGSQKNSNPYDLSKQQLETFGNRFPQRFRKVKLLGRGGFSLVWLGEHETNHKQFAIKQIKTENNHQTHIKEIWFGTYFFDVGGKPKKQFVNHPGIRSLVKIYSYDINKKDTWIFYEKCGESLGNALYDLKADNYAGQRLYRSEYKPLYHRIRKNQNELRKIIIEVAKALQLLAENKIVHSDLKTQNILVKLKYPEQSEQKMQNQQTSVIQQVKLIDYGSSFSFTNLKQFSMATPEYMAPQILNYILYENQLEYAPKLLDFLKDYKNPWVIDVWSLGCVLLQLVSGIPLWMSLKTLVTRRGNDIVKYGLFAVKGRLFDKIIKKQLQVVKDLDEYLSEQNYSGLVLDSDLKTALKRMLSIDPSKRISPSELIKLLSAQQTS